MSNDNGLEPGWLSRQMESVQREERNRAIAETWARMVNELPTINPYLATEEYLRQFEAVVVPAPDGATARSFEVELRNTSPRIIPTDSLVHFQIRPVEPQDNRCMDTVVRSMTNEASRFNYKQAESVPLGEYEFSYHGTTIRFTVSCHTVLGDERLVYVMWGTDSCLGLLRLRQNDWGRLSLSCRHGSVSVSLGKITILSQQSDSPPVPVSHVRRVEL